MTAPTAPTAPSASLPAARGSSDAIPARRTLRASLAGAVVNAWRLARETGAIGLAGLDGLVAGLVVGYVIATGLSGPTKHLGIPWLLEMVLVGLAAGLLVMLGALAGLAARRLLLLAGSLADRALRRVSRRWTSTRLRAVAASPARLLRGLPVGWLGALAVVLVVANVGGSVGPLGLLLPAGAFGAYVVLAGIVVALVAAATRLARAVPTRTRRAAVALMLVAAVGTTAGGAAVFVSPGSAAPALHADPVLDGLPVATDLDDPGAPGPYAVRAVSYGSGTDERRPAFGREALVLTPTVDGSPALRELGWGADEAREWFWGFGRTRLPLNGLAWLPVGAGPFPLVLVVHGNHAMGDFSEPGYAYLGEHLASRGFVTVSVDEDFLNGSWAGDWGGSEQLARAWLLLLHLDQWRSWTADPGSPFFGLVDMARVALMGHSRGGEAAAVAAMLAQTDASAPPGLEPWPTGLRVTAVVAIAPSDGQYDRTPVTLRGVDYLTLHGGHDGDATSWMGIRQYARTAVGDEAFRAAIWSYRSNHGQFSTVWGRSDQGAWGDALLDLGPIQEPEAQRDIARTAIGAFLEASLHARVGYRDLFRRPMVGREWLPEDDIFLVRSMDDAFVSLTGGASRRTTVKPTGFESARTSAVPLRSLLPDQLTTGVELRWAAGAEPATWEIRGLSGVDREGEAVAIGLSLANGTLPADVEERPLGPLPLDPLVELATTDGVTVALPLSRWGALPPPLEVTLVKNELLAGLATMDVALGAPPERVLQSYEIPLADYAALYPAFRPDRLDGIRLIIDRTAAGSLWVAEVGLIVD